MSLRAHTDELQIQADKDVTVISVNGEIHINAQSKIEIIGADSSIVLDGGDITFTTPGTWAAKASAAAFLGGGSGAGTPPNLPTGLVTVPPNKVQLRMGYHDGEALVGARYQATLPGGASREGVLDAAGFVQLDDVPHPFGAAGASHPAALPSPFRYARRIEPAVMAAATCLE